MTTTADIEVYLIKSARGVTYEYISRDQMYGSTSAAGESYSEVKQLNITLISMDLCVVVDGVSSYTTPRVIAHPQMSSRTVVQYQ